jgi:hypothetical protein
LARACATSAKPLFVSGVIPTHGQWSSECLEQKSGQRSPYCNMIPTRARTHPHRPVMQHAFMQSHLLSALALGFAEAVSIVSTCGLWHRGRVDANSDLVPAQWREGVTQTVLSTSPASCNQLKRLLCSQRTATLTAPLTQTKIPTHKAILWAAAGWQRDTFNHGQSATKSSG